MILAATNENIKLAASKITAGDIVAFPTETVYGLGANAFDAKAVEKIYNTKRSQFDIFFSRLYCYTKEK
jgi:L-threonylcarbamoyladenylate synthase